MTTRHPELHRTEHIGWLRAAVLGANDGLISTSSLVVGVAAAQSAREPVLLAALAGLVAGVRPSAGMNDLPVDQISTAFGNAGLEVPSAREVLAGLRIDRARAEKLLQILLKEGALVKISEDLMFHRSALTRLRELLARRKMQNNRLSVATFKDLTGLSRKYAIPLLEYLDRERVTRREGDERIIL